ncbi:Mss4-like protein [Suillus ampliporus]|nr:Mss4-like protein [Suillus ampliporus]
MHYTGSCYCGQLKYSVELGSADKARTSLCHCNNCRKFTGGNYGITTKVIRSSFHCTTADRVMIHRDFCVEYGPNAGDFIYVFSGTFDGPAQLHPKGEFLTKCRAGWMP